MTTRTTDRITIDCQTCPARGRLCGDCFVPVLGRQWLGLPLDGDRSGAPRTGQDPARRDRAGQDLARRDRAGQDPAGEDQGVPERPDLADGPGQMGQALTSDELAAVGAFVRAGLVDPEEAARARAEVDDSWAWAVG